jgi:hypothetical protein
VAGFGEHRQQGLVRMQPLRQTNVLTTTYLICEAAKHYLNFARMSITTGKSPSLSICLETPGQPDEYAEAVVLSTYKLSMFASQLSLRLRLMPF